VIAVDTNVVVRLIAEDEPEQTRRAVALFRGQSVFLAKTVLLESEWVLRNGYEISRLRVLTSLRQLCGLPRVAVEDARAVAKAFAWAEAGMDFADALHLASAPEGASLATFDRRFVAKARTLRTGKRVEIG